MIHMNMCISTVWCDVNMPFYAELWPLSSSVSYIISLFAVRACCYVWEVQVELRKKPTSCNITWYKLIGLVFVKCIYLVSQICYLFCCWLFSYWPQPTSAAILFCRYIEHFVFLSLASTACGCDLVHDFYTFTM